MIADVAEEEGRQAAATVQASGGRALFLATDVGDAGQAQRLVDEDAARFWGESTS